MEISGLSKTNKPDHRWKFTGVELVSDFDLQWYDYRYRKNYNPQVARFFSVDPIAEQYIFLTPYQHASNNPITKIELEGLEGVPAKKEHNQASVVTLIKPIAKQVSKRLVPVMAPGLVKNRGPKITYTSDGLGPLADWLPIPRMGMMEKPKEFIPQKAGPSAFGNNSFKLPSVINGLDAQEKNICRNYKRIQTVVIKRIKTYNFWKVKKF